MYQWSWEEEERSAVINVVFFCWTSRYRRLLLHWEAVYDLTVKHISFHQMKKLLKIYLSCQSKTKADWISLHKGNHGEPERGCCGTNRLHSLKITGKGKWKTWKLSGDAVLNTCTTRDHNSRTSKKCYFGSTVKGGNLENKGIKEVSILSSLTWEEEMYYNSEINKWKCHEVTKD